MNRATKKMRPIRKRSKKINGKKLRERSVRVNFGPQIALPDRLVTKYKWHSLPVSLTSNSNTPTYGDSIINMSSMLDIINGTAATIPYWNQGIQENYKRYRVIHDSIHVTFNVTSGVLGTECLLVPTLDTTAITTDAIWTNFCSLPMAKTSHLAIAQGGPNVLRINHKMAVNKLFDPQQFNVQDEYSAPAGAVGLANPATMAYWRIATRSTTGGSSTLVTATFTVIRTVQLYEIERDSNVQALKRAQLAQENAELRELVANLTSVRLGIEPKTRLLV